MLEGELSRNPLTVLISKGFGVVNRLTEHGGMLRYTTPSLNGSENVFNALRLFGIFCQLVSVLLSQTTSQTTSPIQPRYSSDVNEEHYTGFL